MRDSINGMAERFRDMLAQPGTIELPGCYDVLSAMVLESVGFRAVFLSGYGVSASMFGNPDIGLTSLSETATVARLVANALNIPMVVDADNGYGNADNVVRTVYELESAGAACMVLEDQVLPKRCGHTGNKKILPLPLYMRKLECALRSRQTPMCVIARTDAMELDEGISRAKRFHAAGADVVLIDGLRSLDDAKRVADEVPGHKHINLIYGGKTPILPLDALAELGFKVVLYSTPALYVAFQALKEQMARLHETHDLNTISERSIQFGDFQAFLERRYKQRPHNLAVGHLESDDDNSWRP